MNSSTRLATLGATGIHDMINEDNLDGPLILSRDQCKKKRRAHTIPQPLQVKVLCESMSFEGCSRCKLSE